jgi:hypothetical protein
MMIAPLVRERSRVQASSTAPFKSAEIFMFPANFDRARPASNFREKPRLALESH